MATDNDNELVDRIVLRQPLSLITINRQLCSTENRSFEGWNQDKLCAYLWSPEAKRLHVQTHRMFNTQITVTYKQKQKCSVWTRWNNWKRKRCEQGETERATGLAWMQLHGMACRARDLSSSLTRAPTSCVVRMPTGIHATISTHHTPKASKESIPHWITCLKTTEQRRRRTNKLSYRLLTAPASSIEASQVVSPTKQAG